MDFYNGLLLDPIEKNDYQQFEEIMKTYPERINDELDFVRSELRKLRFISTLVMNTCS